MSDHTGIPFTVTGIFMDHPPRLLPEAWGILRGATCGKDIFPDMVGEWTQDSLMKFLGRTG